MYLRILLFLISIIIPSLSTAKDYDALLVKADEMRSSDIKGFITALDELNTLEENLTSNQKNFLNYLTIFSKAFAGKMKISAAVEELEKLYSLTKEEELKFRILSSIVNYHAIQRDYHSGTIALNRLYKLRDTIKNPFLINNSYVIAGIFYGQSEQHEMAKESAKSLLELSPPPRNECFARSLLIDANLKSGTELPNFLQFIDESIAFCQNISEKLVVSMIYIHKAKYLLINGDFASSKKLLDSQSEFIASTQYGPVLTALYSTLAKIEFESNDLETAQTYGELAVQKSANFGHVSESVEALFILYEIAVRQKNLESSLNNFKKFHFAEKAYLDEVKTRQLAVQQAMNETIEKETQITLLDKENTLLKTQAELSQKEAQNNQLLLALASTLVILLFLWTYRSRRIQIRLRKMAQTDALTGINNRNHFTVSAEHQLRQSRLVKNPVSFILFDLDHFKKINDTYGHQTGDWALKHAVDAAKSVCRSNDIIGRMGGEEFALLLPNCSADKAAKIAEMCRKSIENIKTDESGYSFSITASFGVSDSSTCEYDFDKLYGCADSALYKSKTHGRNQVYKFNADETPVFG